MLAQTPLALMSLVVLAHVTTGCAPVDNSGGPPPAGDALELELLDLPGTCGTFQSDAFLVKDQATLDAFFASCDIPDASRAAWQTAVDALAADEGVVYANVQLGGCLGAFAIEGAFLDGTTVNAWVLRQDFAHGKPNTACTDDIGEGAASMKVTGVGAATDAALTIGDFNPELPGAPQIVLP
jgi:hypothetical protein